MKADPNAPSQDVKAKYADAEYLAFITELGIEKDKYKAQRDKLLEALKYARSCLDTDGNDPIDAILKEIYDDK